MKNNKTEYCNETKKYCYSSEAKATRALNKYDEIKRVYLCSSCGTWHSTSKTTEYVLEHQELSSEEEIRLLRELNNKLADKITELEKEIKSKVSKFEPKPYI